MHLMRTGHSAYYIPITFSRENRGKKRTRLMSRLDQYSTKKGGWIRYLVPRNTIAVPYQSCSCGTEGQKLLSGRPETGDCPPNARSNRHLSLNVRVLWQRLHPPLFIQYISKQPCFLAFNFLFPELFFTQRKQITHLPLSLVNN